MDTLDVHARDESPRARPLGVRASLAVLALGCILPITTVGAYLIYNYYEFERQRLTADAIARARGTSLAVDRAFASVEASLLALSTSERLHSGDLAGFHRRASVVLQKMNADSIALTGLDGQLLLSTRRTFGEPLPALPSSQLVERIRTTGKAGVSDLFAGPLAGEPIFMIGVPLQRNDVVTGSLDATIQPAQLVPLLTAMRLPNTWRAAIVDSIGTVVARSHEMDKYIGAKASPDVISRLPHQTEASFDSTTLDGLPVTTVYSRSPATGWAVVLGIPLDELTFTLRQSMASLITAVFIALIVGLLLAWIAGGRIAQSITALAGPARALGSGRTVEIPTLHFKEAVELGDALVDAGATLDKAKHDAHHDPLTGLANRTLFHIVVNQQLELCRRYKRELSVLFLDLDGFKGINDTHGHALGDLLLRGVSMRIRTTLRASDIAARLGGDEFAVCLLDTGPAGAMFAAQKMIDVLSEPFLGGGVEANVSASVGVATYPASAADGDTLLKFADRAMYQAKSLGKSQVCAA